MHRLNVVRLPLHRIRHHLNCAWHLDDLLLDIVQDVLASKRTQPEEDTVVKPVFIHHWLLGSDLVAAALTKRQQSGVERSKPGSLIWRLAIIASGSVSEQSGRVSNKPCHDRMLGWNPPPDAALEAQLHCPQPRLDLLGRGFHCTVGLTVERWRVLLAHRDTCHLEACQRFLQKLHDGRLVVRLQQQLAIS